jgi:SAM-dependent methyltransferase
MAKRYDAKKVGQWSRAKRMVALKDHFTNDWAEAIRVTSDAKTGSGYAAALVINEIKPGLVLDIGCGNNIMRKYIDNLIGIDLLPYQGNTDIIGDVMDILPRFKDNSVDAIRSVGPFNFGRPEEVEELIEECQRVLKPGGLICCHARPGRKTDKEHFQQRGMIHHPWTRDEVYRMTEKFNFELMDPNPSVPDMQQAIIMEFTDMTQVSWEVLESYTKRYDPDHTTVDEWNQWVDRQMSKVEKDAKGHGRIPDAGNDMFDKKAEYESFGSILDKCRNERYRRLKDIRYDPAILPKVRGRYNWWWKKK